MNLQKVFRRLSVKGLTLNLDKCLFSKETLEYFGFIFLKSGMKPSVSKILVLKEAKRPKDIKGVRSYLGIINYLKHFIPDFSTPTYPIRKLTHQDIKKKIMANKINFISNNVKGLQSTNKRLKLIKYFKDKIFSNGFLFLQETHSVNDEIKGKDDFNGEVFYLHGKSNSCGVLICFIGSKKCFIRNKLSDNDGRLLILDADIDDENFILINLYNPNTEAEQLKTFSKLTEMLTKLHLTQNNNIICDGDFNLFFNVKLES